MIDFSYVLPTGKNAGKTTKEVFLAHAEKLVNGCWNWSGRRYRNGYGKFSHRGRDYLAHRVAYLMMVGQLHDGQEVCHDCDHRDCVNPDHLFAGTHSDNMRDMVAKGRCRPCRGEQSPAAKLTEADVVEMLQLHSQGVSQAELAKKFRLSPKQVSVIVNRKQWKHVAANTEHSDKKPAAAA